MPTIVTEPTIEVINPVSSQYCCLEYIFQTTDAVLFSASRNVTLLIINDNAIPLNEGFVLTNNDPTLNAPISLVNSGASTFDGYTIQEPPFASPDLRADSLILSLRANPYLDSRYNFSKINVTFNEATVRIEAKEFGAIYDLDVQSVAGNSSETWFTVIDDTDGADLLIRDDFQFVIQIWRQDGVFDETFLREILLPGIPVTELSYVQATYDLAKGIDLFLTYHFPDINQVSIIHQSGLSGRFKIKHGVAYKENGVFRTYSLQELGLVLALKAIKQRVEDVNFSDFFSGIAGQKFLTSMNLESLKLSKATYVWLYVFVPLNTTHITVKANVYYFNGPSELDLTVMTETNENLFDQGIYSFPAGPANLPLAQLASSDIESYEVWVEFQGAGFTTYITEKAHIQVDKLCLNDLQFFYRNRFGGIDTIEFKTNLQTAINAEYSEHCELVECGDEAFQGGLQITSNKSFQAISAQSQRHSSYANREYIKAFYQSAWKGTIYKDELVTIVPLSNQFPIDVVEELNIRSEFVFRYNFENIQ